MGEYVPTYHLYRLDGAGRISGAEWIEAIDDEEARQTAQRDRNSPGYEIWDRDRRVERVNAAGPPPPPLPNAS